MGGGAAGVHPIHSCGPAGHGWYRWMRDVAHHVAKPAVPTPEFRAALGRVEALTEVFIATGRGAKADNGWTHAEFERCCKTAGARLLDCDPDDEAYASQSHDDEGGQL